MNDHSFSIPILGIKQLIMPPPPLGPIKNNGPVTTGELVIIGLVPVNDHDLILRTITDTWGKLSLYAKHARKGTKRYGGSLDLFVTGTACIKRLGSELPLLTGLEKRRHLIAVESSLSGFACANLFAQALDYLCQEADASTPGLFSLTVRTLGEIKQDSTSRGSLRNVTRALHELLVIHGFLDRNCPASPSPRALRGLVATIESLTNRSLSTMDAVETIIKSLPHSPHPTES